jgi:hypothetical protein
LRQAVEGLELALPGVEVAIRSRCLIRHPASPLR